MLEGRKLAVRSNVDILGVSLVMAQAKQGKTGKTANAMKSASKVKKTAATSAVCTLGL